MTLERIESFRRAAESGDAGAQFILGAAYMDGHGVQQDFAEAVRWFRLAAESGDAGAQFNLGAAYMDGHGVQQDSAEAVRWFRLAAAQGDVEGQVGLGVAYMKGEGVRQDSVEGVLCFRLAAESGDAGAQFNLGVAYMNGHGVQQDSEEAIRWFRLAAEQGHTAALDELNAWESNESNRESLSDSDALRRGVEETVHPLMRKWHEWRALATWKKRVTTLGGFLVLLLLVRIVYGLSCLLVLVSLAGCVFAFRFYRRHFLHGRDIVQCRGCGSSAMWREWRKAGGCRVCGTSLRPVPTGERERW